MCSAPFSMLDIGLCASHAGKPGRHAPPEKMEPVADLRPRVIPTEVVGHRPPMRRQERADGLSTSGKGTRVPARRAAHHLHEMLNVAQPPPGTYTRVIGRLARQSSR